MKYGLILILFLVPFVGISQRTCGTMEQDSINRLHYPEMGSLAAWEQRVQAKIAERRERELAGRLEAEVLTIPVIVHIVHNGQAVGSGSNLTYEQIQSQLEVLNEDFRKALSTPGYNDHPSGADIEIEFCLTPVDEEGIELTEPGVHRYNGGRADWSQSAIEGVLKPATIVNPEFFYNVWVVAFDNSFPGTLLGYAQFPVDSNLPGLPDGGSSNTDGVVVNFISFGSSDKGDFSSLSAPHDKGRTLTHETGHWLGLRHIWGDGPCADDYCDDTPTQGEASRGCPIGQSTCGSLDMIENYMDYTDDVCQNIFTKDQKARILAVMELSPRRKSLAQNSLCSSNSNEMPVARFEATPESTLRQGKVNYKDLSTNFPTTWSWTFEGGLPASSTERNPEVAYDNPGFYDVRLVVTNANGADTLFADDYMNVLNEGVCNELSNFEAGYNRNVLMASAVGDYNGYLTGQSELGYEAISEFYANPLRYSFISGVQIRFGYAYAADEDAVVKINVWNARGVQGAPGAIIEQKQVPILQILDDIANDRPTSIVFDRETPVFNSPFHVGIELDYEAGDTVALVTSANGESDKLSTWKNDMGKWGQYAIDLGVNIAAEIDPIVGMDNSVQVSASSQVVASGSKVVLQARGASLFLWNSDDGEIEDFQGPQLEVNPKKTTTYTVSGSGIELCDSAASVTIYVKELTATENQQPNTFALYPNPASDMLSMKWSGSIRGKLTVSILNQSGQLVRTVEGNKTGNELLLQINVMDLASGLYVLHVQSADGAHHTKFLKN